MGSHLCTTRKMRVLLL